MNAFKKIFKVKFSRIWFIVSCVLLALIITVSSLLSTVLYDVMEMVFGRDGGIVSSGGSTVYFKSEAKTKKEAFANASKFNEEICEEGFVLLKNTDNALPLKDNEKSVSVFGKNTVDLVYSGSGSAGGEKNDKIKSIYDSLTAAGIKYNPDLKSFYENNSKSGTGRPANPSIEQVENGDADFQTGETPWSSYSGVTGSFANYKDAAVVMFSRIGGEGFDLTSTKKTDGHYLQLDENEKDLLTHVTQEFSKVIVVINSSNIIEAGELENNDKIQAIIHIGGPGYSGIMALGRILTGEVNPSGHTVDTWATDFMAAPAMYNFSTNGVTAKTGGTVHTGDQYNNGANDIAYYFVDYEEGIYVGYRYYETRGASGVVGGEGEEWYKRNVVYPFGYGLSYTTFSWEIENEEELKDLAVKDGNKNSDIEIKVKVTNTGDRAGKDVVQLYATAPYTSGKIEKPYVQLCGFEKTVTLYPAAEANGTDKPNSQTVTIKFNPYDIASYDYNDKNGNSFKGYELDGGEYSLALKTDAHNAKSDVNAVKFTVAAEGVRYGNDPVTNKSVSNRFVGADAQLDIVLSRADWTGTWPSRPNGKNVNDYEGVSEEALKSTAVTNPETEFEKYTVGAEATKQLIEMRGKSYDDSGWDEILNSLSFKDMKDLYNKGAFGKIGILYIGLPATIDSDGPVGFSNFVSGATIYGTMCYASEVITGSTWNREIAEKYGKSVGDEGLIGKEASSNDAQRPYSGWYAPGVNIHRTPFGGRNCEYFSEDGFLSGNLAAAEIAGANSKGVITYMKHFALNEQETHRDSNGIATWATEQSIREIYLKPFETAVKKGEAKGIMTSFNRIGTTWTGGNYDLITNVLKTEWGFNGIVICDFNVSRYMNTKQMAYAGGSLNLTTTRPWESASANNAGDVAMLRRAAHDILYSVVNSCAMNGIDSDSKFYSKMPMWQIVMIIIDVVLLIGIVVWGVFAVRAAIKKDDNADAEQTF